MRVSMTETAALFGALSWRTTRVAGAQRRLRQYDNNTKHARLLAVNHASGQLLAHYGVSQPLNDPKLCCRVELLRYAAAIDLK